VNPTIPVDWFQLTYAAIFIAILLGISLLESLKLEKPVLVGAFRACVQLIFVGYLIQYIFDLKNWFLVLIIILVMVFAASQTLIKRLKNPVRGTYIYALIAVSAASILSLTVISGLIIRQEPWYDPRYLIPLSGMIIANGMNGATLAGERYGSEISLRLPEIEMLLSLGQTAREASKRARQQALNTALLPSINNMMVMGIVHLPGMMTGQIIAGENPVTAVKYQIIVILAIAAAVSVSSWIFINLLDKRYFNKHHQLRYELLLNKRAQKP